MSALFNLKTRRLFRNMPPSISDQQRKTEFGDTIIDRLVFVAIGVGVGLLIANAERWFADKPAGLKMSQQLEQRK